MFMSRHRVLLVFDRLGILSVMRAAVDLFFSDLTPECQVLIAVFSLGWLLART